MATLARLREDQTQHHTEPVTDGFITPACFSILFGMLRVLDIQDHNFCKILKVLAKSCSQMHHNSQILIEKLFLSAEFEDMFVHINKIVDELWMWRRSYPEMLTELRWKHRQVYNLRTKLLKFVEKQFGKVWVEEFIKKAEEVRCKAWKVDRNY